MAAHLLLLAPSRFRCTAAAAPCSVLAAARVLLFRGLGDSSSAHLNVLPLPQPPGSAAPGCTLPCGQRTQQQQEPHHLHQWQQPRWLPQQQHHRAQHPNIQQLRSFHNQGRLQQPNPGSTTRTGAAAAGARLPGSGFTTLPNLLSLSRAAMGPWLVYAMTSQQWPVAVALTAAAGATDWLDGFLARRLGHTSKLGSYLDPLADKVFVATAVGTLGYMGMLPAWLAVVVVGRDSTQVVGMFWYRLRMFGGAWPGAAAFFDVDHASPSPSSPGSSSSNPSSSSGGSSTGSTVQSDSGSSSSTDSAAPSSGGSSNGAPGTAGGQGGGLPMIKPLLISKANTALVMALVAGCMGHQWQGLPGQEVLDVLELVTAATTLSSAAAYAHLHWKGKLLASSPEGRK